MWWAPHVQRSASSHALSVSGEITLREVEFEGAKKAYECDGTPADCVKLGIDMLKQEGVIIDVVYAGITMAEILVQTPCTREPFPLRLKA